MAREHGCGRQKTPVLGLLKPCWLLLQVHPNTPRGPGIWFPGQPAGSAPESPGQRECGFAAAGPAPTPGLTETSLLRYRSAIQVGTVFGPAVGSVQPGAQPKSRRAHVESAGSKAPDLVTAAVFTGMSCPGLGAVVPGWGCRLRMRLPWGQAGASVGGNCFKTITEPWQAGALGIGIWVSCSGVAVMPR